MHDLIRRSALWRPSGKRVPGGTGVRDERIRAFIRNFERMEARVSGRPALVVQVGVPSCAGFRVANGLAVHHLVRNDEHLGMVRNGKFQLRISSRFAEQTREINLVLRASTLAPQHDCAVVSKCRRDLIQGLAVSRRDVNARDFHAEIREQGPSIKPFGRHSLGPMDTSVMTATSAPHRNGGR